MVVLSDERLGISLLAFSPHRMAGAGTYTLSLTRALVARAPSRYAVFVSRQYESWWKARLPQGVDIVVCGPDPDRRVLRVLFEHATLPRVGQRHNVRTIFFPHLYVPLRLWPRAIATVYDLLLLSKPTDFAWHKRLYHRWGYRILAGRAARIVTISEFCRRDIVQRLGVQADRIVVAPPGVDDEFLRPPSPDFRIALPARYILSVAGAYPHKRLPTLLESFDLLSRSEPGLSLVLAGTYAGNAEATRALLSRVEARGLGERVVLLPRLRREDMPELFARAAALVSASEFEGFGIPIIEAMALGCPVAASPAEAIVEVLERYGWLAKDFSASALAEATREALTARTNAQRTLEDGIARVRSRYTWERSAATVEAVMSE